MGSYLVGFFKKKQNQFIVKHYNVTLEYQDTT